jgi:hypothetical protein
LGTVRTQIVFQLLPTDAKFVSAHFTPLAPDDLTGLAAYEIAMRPCVNGATLTPVTGRTLSLASATGDGSALSQTSRERFGRPRDHVEAALRERLSGPSDGFGFGRSRSGGDSS